MHEEVMKTLRHFREEDDMEYKYKDGAEAAVDKRTFFAEQTV